jgi:hypothetical protein
MKRLLPLLLLLACGPAWGAWATVASLCTNFDKTAGTTISCTSSATVPVGDVVLVFSAWDNAGTSDADTTQLSCSDSVGNTYTRAGERTEGTGGADAGVVAILCYSKVTTQIETTSTITVTSDSRTAKGIRARQYTIGAGNIVSVAALLTVSDGGVDPTTLTISGLPSQEYLFVEVIGAEGPSTDTYTYQASYTNFSPIGTTGAAAASNIHVTAEQRIFTGTGDTVNPESNTADRDYARVYVALKEAAAPAATYFPRRMIVLE